MARKGPARKHRGRILPNAVLTRQDPHSGLMVVVGEHHPVRRHVYNLCLHCDGTYIDTAACGLLHLWRTTLDSVRVCVRACACACVCVWLYLCPLV